MWSYLRFPHSKARIRTDPTASGVHARRMQTRHVSSKSSTFKAALPILLSGLLTGCAHPGADMKDTGAKTAANRAQAPELSKDRVMLSEGYSILYRDASNLDLAELILYVKRESEAVEKFVQDVSEFAGKLKTDLERIDKDYPGVRIDLNPLPEMEVRKRTAITEARARYFAPVVGKGGREYERTVLIGYANGLNHERYLCKVMADAESDPGLQKFLRDTEKGYEILHNRATSLLEREYFADPDGKTNE